MSKAQCTDLAQPTVALSRSPGDFMRWLARLPVAVFDVLLLWQQRASERTHLRTLDDRVLRDIGLSRADVEREASIPFWRRS